MKRFLLDTSVIAGYLNGREFARELVSPWLERREAVTSIVVYGEVVEHLRGRSNFEIRFPELRELMRVIVPLVIASPEAERYADVRRSLRPPHGPGLIGDMDTLIAATALVHDLTVVTADRDFERVPGLQVHVVSLRS